MSWCFSHNTNHQSLRLSKRNPSITEETKLAVQYVLKLKSNPSNPTYASVFQCNYTAVFETKPNVILTLGLRLRQTILDSGIDLNCIANYSIPETPPWLLLKPHFDYGLYNIGTKSSTPPDEFISSYNELISLYQSYENISTDSSKQASAVASAAVSGDKILVKQLPNNASIFSAESSAVLLALDMISQTSNLKFLIL
jgi:hypothetical protein